MTEFIKNDIVYDLETYPNCFTFCAVHSNGKGLRVYEVSDRKNETDKILELLRNIQKHNARMVGFNNLGFDYPIIHLIIEKAKRAKKSGVKLELKAKQLYMKAQEIIKAQNTNVFKGGIKPSDIILQQLDLFKIHHFDNKARATSLKMIEFNMRSDNIEDLPFEVGKKLSDEEIDILIEYNKHDVMQTLKFYQESIGEIKLREQLSEKLGFNVLNHNDAKIGSDLFISRLESVRKGICYDYSTGRRKIQQTKRNEIVLKDVILPYITFKRPEFKAIKEWFEQQTISETKGVFTDIQEHDLGDVAKYANMRMKRQKCFKKPDEKYIGEFLKDHPSGWIQEEELKATEFLKDDNGDFVYEEIDGKQKKIKVPKKSYWKCWNVVDTLNIVIDDLQYDFGTGGLHGAIKSGIYESDDEYIYVDVDVASYYPNLSIQNELYPEHLGKTFCEIYSDLYDERKTYPKGTPENYALKIALNGTYGKSNDQYSPLYDPKFTMAITINGQLLLCKLAEMLMNVGAKIVYLNTDGLTYKIHKDNYEKSQKAYNKWESVTKLDLEENIYKKMYLRDVNNYIMVTDSDKLKRKGAYEYDGLGWHQNHSSLVISMAAEHELLGRGMAEEFIKNHKNKYDFMLRTKVPRSSRLVLVDSEGNEILQQNICRYYASKDGGKLVKIMPPLEKKTTKYWKHDNGDVAISDTDAISKKLEKNGFEEINLTFQNAIKNDKYLKLLECRLSIDSDYNVKTCNDIDNFNWDIDYDYYINGAKKLINELYNENN